MEMLKPLRSAIGLGDIAAEYTNNLNKSANARIKAKVDYKKSEVNVFCQEMKELVNSQTRDIEGDFTMDIGPYAALNVYSRYKQNLRSWVKETKANRQRCINQIHTIQLLPNKTPITSMSTTCVSNSFGATSSSDKDLESNSIVSSDNQKENLLPLSVSWKEAGLSEEVFGSMWEKAACLVVDEGSITAAPGLLNAKMFASFSCPQSLMLLLY